MACFGVGQLALKNLFWSPHQTKLVNWSNSFVNSPKIILLNAMNNHFVLVFLTFIHLFHRLIFQTRNMM